jgi:hypothetical protein
LSCQSALKLHPGSACNIDPDGRRDRFVPVANRRAPRAARRALTSDGAVRVGDCLFAHRGQAGVAQARFLKRQLSFPVSMISQ